MLRNATITVIAVAFAEIGYSDFLFVYGHLSASFLLTDQNALVNLLPVYNASSIQVICSSFPK